MGSARGGVMALFAGDKLEDNLRELLTHFDADSNGYFGTRGKSRKKGVRNIASDNPGRTAAEFAYMAATNPSITRPIPGKGFTWVMRDGGIVTYRWKSSSDGTPVVELE